MAPGPPQIFAINRAARGESSSRRGQVQGLWLHPHCSSRQLNSFSFCRVVHGAARSDSRNRETHISDPRYFLGPPCLPPFLPPIFDGLLPGCSCHGHHLLAPGSGSAESPANQVAGDRAWQVVKCPVEANLCTSIRNKPPASLSKGPQGV